MNTQELFCEVTRRMCAAFQIDVLGEDTVISGTRGRPQYQMLFLRALVGDDLKLDVISGQSSTNIALALRGNAIYHLTVNHFRREENAVVADAQIYRLPQAIEPMRRALVCLGYTHVTCKGSIAEPSARYDTSFTEAWTLASSDDERAQQWRDEYQRWYDALEVTPSEDERFLTLTRTRDV